jgi:hypothetical protein
VPTSRSGRFLRARLAQKASRALGAGASHLGASSFLPSSLAREKPKPQPGRGEELPFACVISGWAAVRGDNSVGKKQIVDVQVRQTPFYT